MSATQPTTPFIHPLQPWEGLLRAYLDGERCMDDLIEHLRTAEEEICDPEGNPEASIVHHVVINACVEQAVVRCWKAEVEKVKDLQGLCDLLNATEAALEAATRIGLLPDALGVLIDTTDLPEYGGEIPWEDYAVSWDAHSFVEYNLCATNNPPWVISPRGALPSEG